MIEIRADSTSNAERSGRRKYQPRFIEFSLIRKYSSEHRRWVPPGNCLPISVVSTWHEVRIKLQYCKTRHVVGVKIAQPIEVVKMRWKFGSIRS